MNHLRYFRGLGSRQIECAIVGTGGFGRSFLAQARRVPGLGCRVAIDRDADIAAQALVSVGHDPDRIATCANPEAATAAWGAGHAIAAGDLAVAAHLPVEVVLEATGSPEAGARHARLSIEMRKHVVMVTKETDSVVGPVLARMAAQRGVVCSPVDGDQPSLLIGLVTWAQAIGLTVVGAGKSSEYDFVFDRATDSITSNGLTVPAPGFRDWIEPDERSWPEIVAARARLAPLPQRAVPDLCEMVVVANALGMAPDRPDYHAPIARITEVADLMAPAADGGLLQGRGQLDVFNCLRLPGEPSFAGGVFVTVACDDAETWQMLGEKGHVVARNGRTAMIGLPRHLLGLEAATTVFEAALLNVSSGATHPRPVMDLTAHADVDLAAGTLLVAEGHHHTIAGVSGRMTPAHALVDAAPIPYYLLSGCRLKHDIAAGQMIRCGDVDLDENSEICRLRIAQDAITDWN